MTAFPGESVACPWCGVEAGRKCLTVDGRHQFASHSRRIHLEATRDNACDECGAPAGSNCVAQNRFSRARAHAVRVQAHLQRWEQDTPPAPELDADEKADLDYADYQASLERMFPDAPPAEVDAPPEEVDRPLDRPPEEVDRPLDRPPEEVDRPLDRPPEEVDRPLDRPPEEVDRPLDRPPEEALSERDLAVLDFLDIAREEQGGVPPVIAQSTMVERIPMPLRTLKRALTSLQRKGELTIGETTEGRRGPRRYYRRGEHPNDALRIANVTSAPASGPSSGLSKEAPAGREINNQDLLTRPAGAEPNQTFEICQGQEIGAPDEPPVMTAEQKRGEYAFQNLGCLPQRKVDPCRCGEQPCPVIAYMQWNRENAAREKEASARLEQEMVAAALSERRAELGKLKPCVQCIDGQPDRCLRVGYFVVAGRRLYKGSPCVESEVSYAAGAPPKCALHDCQLLRSTGWPALNKFDGTHFYHCPAERDGRNCSALWASDIGWLEQPGTMELRPTQASARYQEMRRSG